MPHKKSPFKACANSAVLNYHYNFHSSLISLPVFYKNIETMVAALTLILLLVCRVFDWYCCNGSHRAICLLCNFRCRRFLFHLSRETKFIHPSGICLIYPALIQKDEENNIWNEGNVYHDSSVNETTKRSDLLRLMCLVKTLISIYYSLFHIVMNYGIIFWGNSYHSIEIF